MSTVLAPLSYGGSITLWACMARASHIILEQKDNYQKQTQRNRLYIHGANGKLMLSIPVKHLGHAGHQKYEHVQIDNSFPWQVQHWKSLQTAYRSSPYFEFYEDELALFFTKKFTHLYAFNKALFTTICQLLGMRTTITHSDTYEQSSSVKDLRPLLEIKRKQAYALLTYTQVFNEKNGFIHNLSILDLLFNEGPNSLLLLQKAAVPKNYVP